MPEVAEGGLEGPTSLPPNTGALEAIARTLRLIPEMDDAQIICTALYACALEGQAYLLRGACAAELRNRCTTRLLGGRGRRDQAGVGAQARMRQLADQIGVNLRTLMVDLRIYETFFKGAPEKITTLARECSLPREFFVTALTAPEPLAALEIAVQKRRNTAYTRRQYREDLRALGKLTGGGQARAQAPHNHCLRVEISSEAYRVLVELSRESGKGQGEIVASALLAFRQARGDGRTKRDKPSQTGRGGKTAVQAPAPQMLFEYGREDA